MGADEVMAECFKPLLGRAAWGVHNGYSSWLRFNFGTPRLKVREPNEESDLPMFRARLVHVQGDHELWVNMPQWLIFQDGARLAHSESEREVIGRAAAVLDGQVLLAAQTQYQPLVTQLTFDLGGRLWISRCAEWEAGDGLWQLRSGENITVLHADGRVTVERPDGERRTQTDYGYGGH